MAIIMKGEYGIREIVEQFRTEITYYSKMEVIGRTPYEKELHQKLIQERTEELIHTIEKYIVKAQQTIPEQADQPINQRSFTLQELAEFNGSDGKAAYVAVNGKVYDMSEKAAWAGGTHFGLLAGNDLTDQFMNCHMGIETVLNQLPQVGTLIKDV
jgi:predicted heme/steroid binding protein